MTLSAQPVTGGRCHLAVQNGIGMETVDNFTANFVIDGRPSGKTRIRYALNSTRPAIHDCATVVLLVSGCGALKAFGLIVGTLWVRPFVGWHGHRHGLRVA